MVVVDELAPHATSCSSARAVYVGGVLLQSTPLRHSFPAAVPVRRRPAILPRDPLQEEKPSLLALRRTDQSPLATAEIDTYVLRPGPGPCVRGGAAWPVGRVRSKHATGRLFGVEFGPEDGYSELNSADGDGLFGGRTGPEASNADRGRGAACTVADGHALSLT